MILQHPDSLRSALDSVFAAPAYHWVRRGEPLAGLRHAFQAIGEWLDRMQTTQPILYRLVIYLLLAGMLALLVHALWRFFTEVRSTGPTEQDRDQRVLRRDEAWYRTEADRLARAGRFAEAIQADFLALVLVLDDRHQLRFHPSKTPAEYARDSQLAPLAREEFRDLVRRLYSYAFARIPCDAADFSDWRQRAAPDRYAPAN
jgi:Domain of unknown function (DUF4129)